MTWHFGGNKGRTGDLLQQIACSALILSKMIVIPNEAQ